MSELKRPSEHPSAWPDDELLAACEVRFTRRSGPGGQHRNKVETAVVLRHMPTGISAEAHEERGQAENRRVALFRLRMRLAVEVRSAQPSTSPSELWISRRRGSRITVADDHRDLPGLIAEALDALAHHDHVPARAAEQLGISGSQLIGLLRQHLPALATLNAQRQALGKPPLR